MLGPPEENGARETGDDVKRDSIHDIWASPQGPARSKLAAAPTDAGDAPGPAAALHLGAPSPRHGMANDLKEAPPGDDGPLLAPMMPPPPHLHDTA